jgi:hypothetical protein
MHMRTNEKTWVTMLERRSDKLSRPFSGTTCQCYHTRGFCKWPLSLGLRQCSEAAEALSKESEVIALWGHMTSTGILQLGCREVA